MAILYTEVLNLDTSVASFEQKVWLNNALGEIGATNEGQALFQKIKDDVGSVNITVNTDGKVGYDFSTKLATSLCFE